MGSSSSSRSSSRKRDFTIREFKAEEGLFSHHVHVSMYVYEVRYLVSFIFSFSLSSSRRGNNRILGVFFFSILAFSISSLSQRW